MRLPQLFRGVYGKVDASHLNHRMAQILQDQALPSPRRCAAAAVLLL